MTNISLLEMGKIKKRNVRETIISILSKEFPLSIKKIYNKVKKEHNLDVTYQAVFKIIKEMIEDNILEKSEREYKLNIIWIKDLESELEIIKNNYLKEKNEESKEPLQNRINDFISELGPKIKDYIGKDETCIIGVSGGGKFFAMGLFKYLLKEGIKAKYCEIDWRSEKQDKYLFKKEEVENKKVILVDSEIYSGITYRTIIEKINKIKNRLKIKDVKFAADRDVPGLADFSRIK